MKITVLNERIQRKGNMTVVVLEAEVRSNDPREIPLVEGLVTAVGKSICCESDNFDELTGKRIARSRAYKILYQKVHEAYKEALKEVEACLRISKECMDKYVNAIKAQDRDINRLIHG